MDEVEASDTAILVCSLSSQCMMLWSCSSSTKGEATSVMVAPAGDVSGCSVKWECWSRETDREREGRGMYVVYVWEWESKAEGGECEMERTGDSRVKNEIEGQTYESERTI